MRKTWDMPLSKENKTLEKKNLKSEVLIPARLTTKHTRNRTYQYLLMIRMKNATQCHLYEVDPFPLLFHYLKSLLFFFCLFFI